MKKRNTALTKRIWRSHFGPIQKDSDGRSCEIHHIDGNHENDSIDNLICLTIYEHYDIHFWQEDWYACTKISMRLRLSSEELSELAVLNNKKMLADASHPFLKRDDGSSIGRDTSLNRVNAGTHHLLGGEIQRETVANGTHNLLKRSDGTSVASDRVADGTHHLLGGSIQRVAQAERVANGTHNFLGPESNAKRIADGTHHLLGERNPSHRRMTDGTHNFLVLWECEHCGTKGKGSGLYHRWHGDRCRSKKP